MYILNLVLGCWLSDSSHNELASNIYNTNLSLQGYVNYWNTYPNAWPFIHYPCRVEHFELYEYLPVENVKLKFTLGGCDDKTKVSKTR